MPDITIGRLRGGLCASWPDPETGKRRRYQLKARSRKDAEAEALDLWRQHAQPKGSVTVRDCWDMYRESLGSKPTAQTLGYMGKAVLPHFGHYRPDQLSRDLCLSYDRVRSEAGKSAGTIHSELGHLRSALVYAQKVRMIDFAPHVFRPPKPTPKERYLTHEEIQRLLAATETPHTKLAVTLLLGTAARVGAILDLTWNRVDFDLGQINLRLEDSRTRKGRAIVPMNGMTRASLQIARAAALTDHVIEYGGRPVKSIRNGFTKAVRRAELEDVTLHTLRHTAAVHMAAAGVSMSKISQYLGHSNTQITERVYARYSPSSMQDAADVLNFTQIRSVRD